MWTSSKLENDAEKRHDHNMDRIRKSMMRVFLGTDAPPPNGRPDNHIRSTKDPTIRESIIVRAPAWRTDSWLASVADT